MAASVRSWLSLWALPLAAGGRRFARTCSERQFLGSRLKQRQLGWQEKLSQFLCCNQLKAKKVTVSHSDTEFLLPCGLQEELSLLLFPGVLASYYAYKTKQNQKQTEKTRPKWKKKEQSKIISTQIVQFDFASQSLTFHCKTIHMGDFCQPNSYPHPSN